MKPPPSQPEENDPPKAAEGSDPEQDHIDDQLLRRLSAVMDEADPPPEGLGDVAMRALTWDVELARLAARVDEEPVLVRDSGDSTRTGQPVEESFEVDDYAIDLTVEPGEPGTVLLRGIITPRVDEVTLTGPTADSRPVTCDQYGRFEVVVGVSTVAVEFIGSDDLPRRTPLLDL